MHKVPTIIQQTAKKQFLPPNALVVDKTKLFFPWKGATSQLLLIVSLYAPAARVASILPHNFLKVGRPAVLIHTMKCQSVMSCHCTSLHVTSEPPGIAPSMLLNLYQMSEDQAMLSNRIFTGYGSPTFYRAKESLKKLLATSPHGIAGWSRSASVVHTFPFKLFCWYCHKSRTYLIGSQLAS